MTLTWTREIIWQARRESWWGLVTVKMAPGSQKSHSKHGHNAPRETRSTSFFWQMFLRSIQPVKTAILALPHVVREPGTTRLPNLDSFVVQGRSFKGMRTHHAGKPPPPAIVSYRLRGISEEKCRLGDPPTSPQEIKRSNLSIWAGLVYDEECLKSHKKHKDERKEDTRQNKACDAVIGPVPSMGKQYR